MGSVFDFPNGVDLAKALEAERLFRAAGLSRYAALALIGAGIFTPDHLLAARWEDQGEDIGLRSALLAARRYGSLATVETVERWLARERRLQERVAAGPAMRREPITKRRPRRDASMSPGGSH